MKVLVRNLALLAALWGVSGQEQQEYVSECPSPNGFFADAVQCDKYYACVDGVIEEKLCNDGMGFNDLNPRVEKCDFLFQIDCKDRPELQRAQATENCPRQFGYFPHPDSTNCGEFYYCHQGIGSKVTCPEGLRFSLKTGTCVWPDEAQRVGCKAKSEYNFTCPAVPADVAVAHPRYPDSDDCQFFFVCVNGKEPRRNGCTFGTVFNINTTACDEPRLVPDCKEFYYPYFDEYFATLGGGLGGTDRAASSVIAAAIASGYEVPGIAKRVKIAPGKQRINSANLARKPLDKNDAPTLPAQQPAQKEAEPGQTRAPSRPSIPSNVPSRTSIPSNVPPRPARPAAPGGKPQRRRKRPGLRRRTTTTTTTTTAAPPLDDYYYDDYYDYPETPAPSGSAQK